MMKERNQTSLQRTSLQLSLLLISLMFLFTVRESEAQIYELIWSDEFDGSALNTENWSYDIGDGCPSLCGWGNNELQYYTAQSDNINVQDGYLNIIAKKERLGNKDYSSARIKTKGLQNFKYGRIESRMKLPIGSGFWPAFWMLSEENVYGGWPRSGEIDIMEYRGNAPTLAEGTIHYWRQGCSGGSACWAFQNNTYQLPNGNFSENFHVFAIEWGEFGIKWFVDDTEYAFIQRDQVDAEWYPFDESFYILLNLAIGGNFLPPPDEDTVFPQTMQVDYVRVYGDMNVPPQIDIPVNEEELDVEPGTQKEINPQIEDSDSSIEEVRFFFLDELIDTRTSPPYNITVDFPIERCYPFRVEATDIHNAVSVSETITFVAGSGCTKAPYNDAPFAVPGTIPMWQYNYGGPDIGYSEDTEFINQGTIDFPGEVVPRPYEAVDLMPVDAEGLPDYAIYEAVISEWLTYDISVAESSEFTLHLLIRSLGLTSLDFFLNEEKIGSLNFLRPSETITPETLENLTIPAGEHTLRVFLRFGSAELYQLELLDNNNTSIEPELGQEIPSQTELLPPYPNPFNPAAKITFRMAEAGQATLELFDLSGRNVQTIFRGYVPAGEWSYTLRADGLSSGMYLVRLTHPSGVLSRPVSLVK